jgi:protein TonB
MTDRYIEKSFIYLLCFSILIHIGVIAVFVYYPPSASELPKEPVFIDLQQMSEIKQMPENRQQETKRRSEQRIRVEKESAPLGDSPKDVQAIEKKAVTLPEQKVALPVKPSSQPQQVSPVQQLPPVQQSKVAPGTSVAGLLKPKTQVAKQQSVLPQLFPAASRLAKLEESYRRKFENDIAEGDTRFLNSDDIVFGSFLRRFEGAVYGVWRYPQEAAMRGIEGITPVRITFNRRGEITSIQQLESSGARILDEEVLRTLRAIGSVGGFPKGYDRDEFHLIAFFQYGGARKSLR